MLQLEPFFNDLCPLKPGAVGQLVSMRPRWPLFFGVRTRRRSWRELDFVRQESESTLEAWGRDVTSFSPSGNLEVLDFSKLVAFAWSMASTGAAASPARPSGSQVISEVWKRLADGEQLTINERAILAWSLSMLPSSPLTPLAIQELQVQMVQVASQLRLEELLGEFAAAAFTVFWSSSFADSLSRSAAQAVWLAMWNALNLEPQLFPVEVVSWAKSSQVDPGMQIFPDQVGASVRHALT